MLFKVAADSAAAIPLFIPGFYFNLKVQHAHIEPCLLPEQAKSANTLSGSVEAFCVSGQLCAAVEF